MLSQPILINNDNGDIANEAMNEAISESLMNEVKKTIAVVEPSFEEVLVVEDTTGSAVGLSTGMEYQLLLIWLIWNQEISGVSHETSRVWYLITTVK